jgi:hypothetical protein
MIITINDFLEVPISRENIEPDPVYYLDEIKMFAGNTKLVQSNRIKKQRWNMTTESLKPEQAFSVASILANLGDYWKFNGDYFSAKGQEATFETAVTSPAEPIIITGAFGSSVRLNDYNMILRVFLESNYLVSFYRQQTSFDDKFYHYVVDDFDRVWIDGVLADETTIENHGIRDWLIVKPLDNAIYFTKEAAEIDEVYVMSGVMYDADILDPANIYQAGEMPITGSTIKVAGDFLDTEDYIICECRVDQNEYRDIGKSIDVEFTLEEDIL